MVVQKEQKPVFLKEQDVAEMLSLSLSALRNARGLGRGIPYVKLGKTVRYKQQDILDYAEKGRVGT